MTPLDDVVSLDEIAGVVVSIYEERDEQSEEGVEADLLGAVSAAYRLGALDCAFNKPLQA